MIKWEAGRQGTGYLKFKICESKLFKFEVYILKYPTGSSIDFHKDPCPVGYEHHRLNLVLKKAQGGIFAIRQYDRIDIFPLDRLIIFRPDLIEHSVTKVRSGTRYVLSIGWLRKEK